MKTYKLWDKTPYYLEGEEDPHIRYYPAENKTHNGVFHFLHTFRTIFLSVILCRSTPRTVDL